MRKNIQQSWRAFAEGQRPYRNYWGPDLILAALFVVVSILFSFPPLDLRISEAFYRGGGRASGWPIGAQMPWSLLYYVPPVVVVFVLLGALVYLALSFTKYSNGRYRIHVFFLFIALWIGPGLIVETLLKLNYGRPRPCELFAFGGFRDFRPAFSPGIPGIGKSFVSGHSSTTYYLTAFYFIFRRSGRYSRGVLLSALTMGTLVGVSRIAAGGHFASDVAWSLSIIFLINLVLYYFVLNLPAREDGIACPVVSPQRQRACIPIAVCLLIAAHLVLYTLSPAHKRLRYETAYLAEGSGCGTLELKIPNGQVELCFVPDGPIKVEGDARGYGWGTRGFRKTFTTRERSGDRRIAIVCIQRGHFFWRDIQVRVEVPLSTVDRLVLALPDGRAWVANPVPVPASMEWCNEAGELLLPADWEHTGLRVTNPSLVEYKPHTG